MVIELQLRHEGRVGRRYAVQLPPTPQTAHKSGEFFPLLDSLFLSLTQFYCPNTLFLLSHRVFASQETTAHGPWSLRLFPHQDRWGMY